jgi:hypothetical protein
MRVLFEVALSGAVALSGVLSLALAQGTATMSRRSWKK